MAKLGGNYIGKVNILSVAECYSAGHTCHFLVLYALYKMPIC
jgi:hypothetical protein